MNSLGADNASQRLVLLTRAPLVPAAAALAVGIAVGRYAPFTVGFWGFLTAAALAAGWAGAIHPRFHLAASAALLAAILGLGASYSNLSYFSADDNDIVTFTDNRPILATVRGRIVTWPQIDEGPSEGVIGYRPEARTTFVAEAEKILTSDGWRATSGLLRVALRHPDRRYQAGQQVELIGMLSRPRRPDNPGGFDWAAQARQQHVLATMTVPAADGAVILSGAAPPWYEQVLWRLRAGSRQHLEDCGDESSGLLLNALVIGERDPALRSLNRCMMRTGVAHLLSISGQHLAIFLGFLYLLCRLVMLSPRRSAAVALTVLVAYMLLAVPQPPLLRSAIMAGAACLAVILHRPASTLNALAAAGILLLAFDPLQLFQAGFQLSFATVAGLILLYRPIQAALFGRYLRRRGLRVYRDQQRFRRWLSHGLADFFIGVVCVSLAASLTSMPLVAYHFGLFSPYAPLLSILLLPLVTAVLVPGYISLALALAMPNLSHAVGELAAWSAGAMEWAARVADLLPGSSLEIRPVPAWWVALFYLVIALVALHRILPWGRAFATVAGSAWITATVFTQLPAAAPKDAELNILAVGYGQCAVLRSPGGGTYLFDAGTRSGFDLYEQTLHPFLRSCRAPQASAMFLSHANSDHYSGAIALAKLGRLKTLYISRRFASADDAEGPARQLLRLLGDEGVHIVYLHAGDKVDLDRRTRVEVLWPPEGEHPELSENDAALVLRIVCDGSSVLLPADIEAATQGALLQSGRDLRANCLMLPHHGTFTKALPTFVAAVSPRTLFASSAVAPAPSALAAEDVRAFYTHLVTGYRLYTTQRHGCIRALFGRGQVEVTTTK